MRITLLGSHVTLLSCAAALLAANAFAQETPPPAAPPPAAAEPAPAPAPAPTPPPAEAPVAGEPAAPGAAAEAAPPPAAPEETYPAAWTRIDYDYYGVGLQLWAGATHALTDTVGIATDVYLTTELGELDIGPAFTLGPVVLTPMLGFQVDWKSQKKAAALVPQLFATGGPDPIYFEFWFQNYNYKIFDYVNPNIGVNKANFGHFRLFVDVKLNKYFAVGPQVEMNVAFNDNAKLGDESITYLPIGGNVMLTNYGKSNTLLLFAGYDASVNKINRDFVGRMTFIHNF